MRNCIMLYDYLAILLVLLHVLVGRAFEVDFYVLHSITNSTQC